MHIFYRGIYVTIGRAHSRLTFAGAYYRFLRSDFRRLLIGGPSIVPTVYVQSARFGTTRGAKLRRFCLSNRRRERAASEPGRRGPSQLIAVILPVHAGLAMRGVMV
jgi:hypothetical protein